MEHRKVNVVGGFSLCGRGARSYPWFDDSQRKGERNRQHDRQGCERDHHKVAVAQFLSIHLGTVNECPKQNLDAVADCQDGGTRYQNQSEPAQSEAFSPGGTYRCQEHFLGHESHQGRDTSHRRGTNCRNRKTDRRDLDQTRNLAKRARVAQVVNHTHHHEQAGLEHGVGNDVDEPRGESKFGSDSHGSDDEPQLTHGGVRHELLQVVLRQSTPATDPRGHNPGTDQQNIPRQDIAERGAKAEQQEDTSLYHRCGVQIRADWGDGRHCVGKPRLERELRRFRHGCDCHEQRHCNSEPGLFLPHARAQHLTDAGASHHTVHGRNRNQQEHSTHERHEHGAQAGAFGGTAGARNQHERRYRRDLPAYEEYKQVVGQHQPHHGKREGGHEQVERIVGAA